MKFKKMIEAKITDRAREVAREQHKKQMRKDGSLYFHHPKRVAELVKKYKQSSKINHLVAAAFLHDTIEDTNTTAKDLKAMFGGLVASLVQELTSSKSQVRKMGKTQYLTKKMLNMSDWGLVIKLADRLDNVSDLRIVGKNFAKKYSIETKTILAELNRKRALTRTQKKLVQAIREKLNEL